MQNEINTEDEIVIDFKKLFKIIGYRKRLILKIFAVFIMFFILLNFILPKKYETDAQLYINKTNSTNIAEFNPYLLAATMNAGGGIAGMLSGGIQGIQQELDIMQSPLVIDNVIKENNLKYKKGRKKGEFLSAKDFLKKNIKFGNSKTSNVVTITYVSKNPDLSYNVVKSVIKNYELVNENINMSKALKDEELLESSYADINENLNKKLSKMKNTATLPSSAMNSLGMLAALKSHNRAVSGALSSVQNQMIEGERSQISIGQDVDKLKLVKTKLEWTKLVKNMADASNVIVLKQPEIKREFEQSEPKLIINLIFGVLAGFIASITAVFAAEKKDEKLNYSSLGHNVIYETQKNLEEIKIFLLTKPKENFLLINFDGFNSEVLKSLSGFSNLKTVNAEITQKFIDEISTSNNLLLAAKIGKTPKKLYEQVKIICKETNKTILQELV